jgi:hypothetical protein
MEGSDLLLGVGETQSIEATVVALNCRECLAHIDFDERHFELVEGSSDIPISSGTFTHTLMAASGSKSGRQTKRPNFGIRGGAPQLVMLPARIHPMPKIER